MGASPRAEIPDSRRSIIAAIFVHGTLDHVRYSAERDGQRPTTPQGFDLASARHRRSGTLPDAEALTRWDAGRAWYMYHIGPAYTTL